MEINLNANEVLVAGYIGMRRNAEASFRNRKPRFPERKVGELWGFHIESAHAECAVAKYLGIYWGFGVNTFHTEDIVNSKIEVRWSHRNDVKVREDDSGIIVSVTGKCPTYNIVGWINANDAKKQEYYFSNPPPCYFYPHTYLNNIETLKFELQENSKNGNLY
jgi:hypothetical protein